MRRTPLTLLLAAVAVLPHELAHALSARLAGLDPEVTLLPTWAGEGTPLGQFDAVIDESTPAWVVRVIAVAPWLTFVGCAVLLGPVLRVALPPVVGLVVTLLLALWGSLSAGDLAVAGNPRAARTAGHFTVPTAGWESGVADLLTVGTVLLVAVLLIA
ncbi:hypothetical protein [Salinirubrum litoreum]|uniref:Peptidase family M50 n=1 Tax=Salinirubrum litoreum TaxID=1126234 RepID=A0ABD5RC85_9EURY|nr:hypothetical protein [Salinirubrum litoreum]